METVQFLGDIDSEKIYAAKLELAYNEVYQEVLKILLDWPIIVDGLEATLDHLDFEPLTTDLDKIQRQIEQMRVVMVLQIRQMAERKRRLADVAVGLTDRVLDEQGT